MSDDVILVVIAEHDPELGAQMAYWVGEEVGVEHVYVTNTYHGFTDAVSRHQPQLRVVVVDETLINDHPDLYGYMWGISRPFIRCIVITSQTPPPEGPRTWPAGRFTVIDRPDFSYSSLLVNAIKELLTQ